MRGDILLAVFTIVLGATGTYMLLPHRHGVARARGIHIAGFAMVAGAFVLLALAQWVAPGPWGSSWLTNLFFYGFGLGAILAAVLMVTSRNPIHSALWFAVVVLATSGLFLLAGAQFLAAGTVIVYAGAIIVTFLFVIMLAQAEGQAVYDRAARAPEWSTISAYVLLWSLVYALIMVQSPKDVPLTPTERADRLVRLSELPEHPGLPLTAKPGVVIDRAVPSATARLPVSGELGDVTGHPHVAGIGATLFTDNLISVEVAGAILFVALVGAAAIATPKPPVRPERSS